LLAKIVALPIPTYFMSVFKLAKDICYSIQSVVNKLWWGHGLEGRKIHRVSSNRLCRQKDDGGISYRDLKAFNDVLLTKQVWRLMHDNMSLDFIF